MKLKIDIATNGAAFDTFHGNGSQVAYILRKLADRLDDTTIANENELLAALYDINGNCVGACEVEA
jgi:lipoate-protein ligase B